MTKRTNFTQDIITCNADISDFLKKDEIVKRSPSVKAFVGNYDIFIEDSIFEDISHSPLNFGTIDLAQCSQTDRKVCYYNYIESEEEKYEAIRGFTHSPPDFFTSKGNRGSTAGDLYRSGVGDKMYDNSKIFIVTDGTCTGYCATFVNRIAVLNLAHTIGIGGIAGEEKRLSIASGPTGSMLCNTDIEAIMTLINSKGLKGELSACDSLIESINGLARGNSICAPLDAEYTFYDDGSLWNFEELVTQNVVDFWSIPSEESAKDSQMKLYGMIVAYVLSYADNWNDTLTPYSCKSNERIVLNREQSYYNVRNEKTKIEIGPEGWVGLAIGILSLLITLVAVIYIVVSKSLIIYKSKPHSRSKALRGTGLESSSPICSLPPSMLEDEEDNRVSGSGVVRID